MKEALSEHSAQIQQMLDEVHAWEGTSVKHMNTRLGEHAKKFEMLFMELESFKGRNHRDCCILTVIQLTSIVVLSVRQMIVTVTSIRGDMAASETKEREASAIIASDCRDERDTMIADETGRNLKEADDLWLERMRAMQDRVFPHERNQKKNTGKKRTVKRKSKQVKLKHFFPITK